MNLMQLSAYGITLFSGALVFILIKHHSHPMMRWFGVFIISMALFYLFSGEYTYILAKKTSCTPIDHLLQRICLFMVGLSALSALQMAAYLSSNNNHRYKMLAWLSLPLYYAAVTIFDNKYALSAIYLLPSALLLMLVFLQNYFTYLEKEISYGVIGAMLLFTSLSFEKLSICLHPISCDCDFCCVILDGIAIALMAKAVHHIISKEGKLTVRKCKKPRPICV